MSSSNIFKLDPAFKPIPLVQEEIPVFNEIMPPEPVDTENTELSEPVIEDIPSSGQTSSQVAEETIAAESLQSSPEPAADIQAIEEQAHKNGFEEASQQYHQQMQGAIEALITCCHKIDTLQGSLLDKYRGDIINTAVSLAERIIASEFKTKRNVIAATLEKALEKAIKSEEFIITLHPDDLDTVEEIKDHLISHSNGLEHIVLKTSTDIAPGGCLLESDYCSVNASLPAQLESARDFLEENTLPLEQIQSDNQKTSS